ncbi:MFS sugar transporter [Marasmius crinis-equi]|uniref:MFS sugar transporter n=1 Tax=Marasmius crinis-equi TaxID=585013 RepID=A0ABR3F5A7_9AGAR
MAGTEKVQKAQEPLQTIIVPVTKRDSHHSPHSSTTRTGAEEVGHEYLEGFKLGLITFALCLSVFLMALDNTILATAIPKITDYFHSLNDVGWYGSAYLLTTASFQLMFGKFYTYFSIKWTFITAISIFEIGSFICGAAPSSEALIVGRAIAGIGSAGVFSGALIVVAHAVPLQKRPLFNGLIGAMYGLASVAGPSLGGAFTDKVTWRWCFYINLPIGAITLLIIAFFFKSPPRQKSSKIDSWRDGLSKFDLWGTLAFIPAVVSLLLALQWGGTKYPWSDGRIIGLFVVFGVLIVIFIGIQIWKQDDATVPPRILMQRSILSSAWFALSLGTSFFIMVYYVPIWFQAIKGTSAVKSGIDNLPSILAVVVASLISGAMITATGYYAPCMILSTVLASVGTGLISTFRPDTSSAKWIGFQVIFGLGIGAGLQQPVLAAQTVLPLHDVPSGTAIIMFAQTAGGALFLSVAQNVFTNKLVAEIIKNAPGVNPMTVLGAGATVVRSVVPQESLTSVIKAYNQALVNAFYVSVAMACLSVVGSGFIEWKNVKESGNGETVAHTA